MDGVEQTVDDLHLLLQKAGVRPPYVLVGASLGGMFVRAYQRRYPEQVAGLVFVDSVHDEGMAFGKPKPLPLMSAGELEAVFHGFQDKPPPPQLPTAVEDPIDRLPKELQVPRLWADRKYQAVRDFSKGLVTVESWRQELLAQRRQRLGEPHPLGDLPLTVLARAKDSDDRRRKMQTELARLSSAGRLGWAENSGHEIHLYRPDFVIQAIREMTAAAREKETEHKARK
jgi:pimeloyl-ACP methyl ester carboxylesterase